MRRTPAASFRSAIPRVLGIGTVLLAAAHALPNAAQAHPAGACRPEIVSPGDGETTSLRPKIAAHFGGHRNCQIDRIGVTVTHVASKNVVLDRDWKCCDVLTSRRNPLEFTVPAGELRPGARYRITVKYTDKHLVTVNDLKAESVTITTASAGGGGSAGQPAPSRQGGGFVSVEPDTDRPGSDYRDFDLQAADPDRCADACEDDSRCEAYTYVPPGRQGPSARCWLKDGVPQARASQGLVSGVKGSPIAQNMHVNRAGSDYRNFDLSAAEPGLCARACAGDSRCKAYTYVPPGRQGPSARCWLKDGVPRASSGKGLVSGVK